MRQVFRMCRLNVSSGQILTDPGFFHLVAPPFPRAKAFSVVTAGWRHREEEGSWKRHWSQSGTYHFCSHPLAGTVTELQPAESQAGNKLLIGICKTSYNAMLRRKEKMNFAGQVSNRGF